MQPEQLILLVNLSCYNMNNLRIRIPDKYGAAFNSMMYHSKGSVKQILRLWPLIRKHRPVIGPICCSSWLATAWPSRYPNLFKNLLRLSTRAAAESSANVHQRLQYALRPPDLECQARFVAWERYIVWSRVNVVQICQQNVLSEFYLDVCFVVSRNNYIFIPNGCFTKILYFFAAFGQNTNNSSNSCVGKAVNRGVLQWSDPLCACKLRAWSKPTMGLTPVLEYYEYFVLREWVLPNE